MTRRRKGGDSGSSDSQSTTHRVPEEEDEIRTTAGEELVGEAAATRPMILEEEGNMAMETKAEDGAKVVKERLGDRAAVDHHHMKTVVGRGGGHTLLAFNL